MKISEVKIELYAQLNCADYNLVSIRAGATANLDVIDDPEKCFKELRSTVAKQIIDKATATLLLQKIGNN